VSAFTRDVRQLARTPALVVWSLFVLMAPFYVLPSGLPQPGDILVLVLVPVTLLQWSGRLNRGFTRTLRALVWFVLWVCLVNYSWAIIVAKTAILKSFAIFPIYYLFNASVFLSVLVLYQRTGETILRMTVYMIFSAVMFQVLASFVIGGGMHRSVLFFNSPNQLGYYALLAASLIAMIQRRLGFGLLKASAGLTGCAYLALLSGSRAAIAGIAILLFLLVFSNPRIIIVASLAAVLLLTIGGPIVASLDRFQDRVTTNRNPNLTFTEERGYDRLWTHSRYLAVGAGEGDVARFQHKKTSPGEIHSSFATILFSYGIVGLALFLVFLRRLIQGSSMRSLAMLAPTLAFTLAHNGLRETMLWVLLAIFLALKVPTPSVAPRAPRQLGNSFA
jgi:hypothetical protein